MLRRSLYPSYCRDLVFDFCFWLTAAGYSLKLDPESCSISQETAYISLVWIEPAPGMVAAQVITNPFILLKLSKGGYDAVKVVDQHEQTRFDLPVDE